MYYVLYSVFVCHVLCIIYHICMSCITYYKAKHARSMHSHKGWTDPKLYNFYITFSVRTFKLETSRFHLFYIRMYVSAWIETQEFCSTLHVLNRIFVCHVLCVIYYIFMPCVCMSCFMHYIVYLYVMYYVWYNIFVCHVSCIMYCMLYLYVMYHVLYDMYVLCLHAACIVLSAVLRRKINEMLSSNYRASSCRSMCLHDVVVVVAQAQVPLSHLTCCERLRGCGVPCAGPHTRLCHLSVSQWLESVGCVPGDPDQATACLSPSVTRQIVD